MSNTSAQTSQLSVTIAEDRMKAWVELPPPVRPNDPPPSLEEVLRAIAAAGVSLTEDTKQRIAQLAHMLATAVTYLRDHPDAPDGRPEVPARWLIAVGQEPKDAIHGRFEWREDLAQKQAQPAADGSVDHYSENAILTLPAGTRIGHVVPPVEAVDGRDVTGAPVPPRRRMAQEMKVGEGLKTERGGELVTTQAGRVQVRGQDVWVDEVLEVRSDVDFSTGNIDACIDVSIRGNIKANFSVHTSKGLNVGGAVESARIDAKGPIDVHGGIFGQGQGSVRSAQSVHAHLADDAIILSAGDIEVDRELINSAVACYGTVRVPRGAIIGGEVYGRQGLVCHHVGSGAGVVTVIAAGLHASTAQQAAAMRQRAKQFVEQAAVIRQRVEPLMANLKRLTKYQREQATELIGKASELELQADMFDESAEKTLREGAPPTPAQIVVTNRIYPGTRIRFGLRETMFQKEVSGEYTIRLQQVEGVTEIVLINMRTKSVTVLPSGELVDDQIKPLPDALIELTPRYTMPETDTSIGAEKQAVATSENTPE